MNLLVRALLEREVLSGATISALFEDLDNSLPSTLGLAASVKRNPSEG
jgi:hypothetical protein